MSTQITFGSDIYVDLVKHSAQDVDVVMAARVSTQGDRSLVQDESAANTGGLINFLMRERHGSPFEHSYFTFYVKAPIFVWREHMRHRVASYNEESGRYKVLDPEFYVPDHSRALIQTGKTGYYEFLPGSDSQHQLVDTAFEDVCRTAYERYVEMLNEGIAREVARQILPLNIYSSAYVTVNARSLMNIISLRTKAENATYPSYPQREIEMVAEAYEAHFQRLMPLTHRSFMANGRVAP